MKQGKKDDNFERLVSNENSKFLQKFNDYKKIRKLDNILCNLLAFFTAIIILIFILGIIIIITNNI